MADRNARTRSPGQAFSTGIPERDENRPQMCTNADQPGREKNRNSYPFVGPRRSNLPPSRNSSARMNTRLGSYCLEFDRLLRPLLAAVACGRSSLAQAPPATPGRQLATALATTGQHLQVLCDKVLDQQAYVLIFGPLKSGKSTLMNAIAATYVSEVSSLPAYPCLVFVAPGAHREYLVSRYNGQTQSFTDPRALARFIDQAHSALADAIRSAEQSDLSFDPEHHFPEAIRRVEVRLPDTQLQSTSAVLVDTPGLYTRMRFGYDRMTRDFRDAAACAIFVVKSDTLFLEQVFAEFHELLDLFSRIFLIVNIDSHKRDVGPDGQLVPSLEQSRPEAILQAFQQLAMSAPLHRAAAEGRVRMYPVDLLQAAASTLQHEPEHEQPASFTKFRQELTEFLSSDEYLATFLRDSMRRAETLTGELLELLGGDELRELESLQAHAGSRTEHLQAECDLIERALQIDLTAAFARADSTVADDVERAARDGGQRLFRTLGASIDTWFLSGHSLHWLVTEHWGPLLADYRAEVARAGRRALDQTLQQRDAGLDLPSAITDLCERLEVDLRAVRGAALCGTNGLGDADAGAAPVAAEAIPLRRSLLDRFAFRPQERVRDRLFGDRNQPDRKIPAREKARRLGQPGRLYLHQCVTRLRAQLTPATAASVRRHFEDELRSTTIARIHQRLGQELPSMKQQLEHLSRERTRLQQLLEPLRELQRLAEDARRKLPALGQAFGAGKAFGASKPTVLLPQARAEDRPEPVRQAPVDRVRS